MDEFIAILRSAVTEEVRATLWDIGKSVWLVAVLIGSRVARRYMEAKKDGAKTTK